MSGNTREKVIEKFAEAFLEKYNNDEEFSEKVDELREEIKNADEPVKLGCWCAPKACHGDFLKEFLQPNGDKDAVKVVNVRKSDEVDVYIGRGKNKSHMNNTKPGERGWLGNPFEL